MIQNDALVQAQNNSKSEKKEQKKMRAIKSMQKIKLRREKTMTLESLCPDAVFLKKTSPKSFDIWVWAECHTESGLKWQAIPPNNILTQAF